MQPSDARRRGAVAVAALALLGAAAPAARAQGDTPQDIGQHCPAAMADDRPPALGLRLDPAEGGEVVPGQTVTVAVTWDAATFGAVGQLRRALACVTVDDVLQPVLSAQEKPSANDGLYEHRFTLPADARDGARLCAVGVAAGGSHGEFTRERSASGCLTVRAPAEPPTAHETEVAELCPQAVAGPSLGSARLDTSPPPGAEILAGQSIAVRLTWRPADFAGDRVDKVAHCVTVDGGLDPSLSAVEAPSANDGELPVTVGVPAGLAPGSRVCGRGFVQGEGWQDAFLTGRSDEVCFTVVPAVVAVPVASATGAPPPSAVVPAAVAPAPPARPPAASLSAGPARMAELPRTGFGPRELAMLGTAVLGAGVWCGRAARRRPRSRR